MPSRKHSGKLAQNQRFREQVQKSQRLGASCSRCGLIARRVSDSFCSSCGIALPQSAAQKAASTGGRSAVSPDVVKAAVIKAVHAELDPIAREIEATSARITELERMAHGQEAPGWRAPVLKAAAPVDPFAEPTVDGRPASTDPLLRAELNSHDPARREAAWRAIYSPREGN